MATVVICRVTSNEEDCELAVIVGKNQAFVVPFKTSKDSSTADLSGKPVALSLNGGCSDDRPAACVQTEASASNTADTKEDGDEDANDAAAAAASDGGKTRHAVASAAFNSNGRLLAVCGDERNVNVYCTETWTKLHAWAAKRRVCTLRFASRGDELLLADKTGDIYKYKCGEDFTETPEMVLGHISVLLDIGVSLDNRFIFSCDRDDKVRVSRYPNAYNIESFCLGHTQFVSCLASTVKYPDNLFSGSGDGCVIMWQFKTGSLLSKLELSEQQPVSVLAASATGRVAIAQEKSCDIHLAAVTDGSLHIQHTVRVNAGSGGIVSMVFSDDDFLWVLRDNADHPVDVVHVPAAITAKETVSLVIQPSLQQSLTACVPMVEGFLHSHLDMDVLAKEPMDGLHRYFERKNERLQQASSASK